MAGMTTGTCFLPPMWNSWRVLPTIKGCKIAVRGAEDLARYGVEPSGPSAWCLSKDMFDLAQGGEMATFPTHQ